MGNKRKKMTAKKLSAVRNSLPLDFKTILNIFNLIYPPLLARPPIHHNREISQIDQPVFILVTAGIGLVPPK